MENPFEKRATEYFRDEEAFLAVISPEPIRYFMRKPAEAGLLYDRLVIIQGTPGSGKTTLARLFEYPAIAALLRNQNISSFKALMATLSEAGAIVGDYPRTLGCRLSLETDYREFWEFNYPADLKLALMTALLQARAVLAWVRHLNTAGVETGRIRIVPRSDAEAAIEAIGGYDGTGLVARARQVETALYHVIGALVPPDVSELETAATAAYHPFDVIESVCVEPDTDGNQPGLRLLPLLILDDAHSLHPEQFRRLRHWLTRRELRVSRWVLTRFDVLQPHEALRAATEDDRSPVQLPGITATRDTTEITLQSGSANRPERRKAFRRIARDMSGRYLRTMPLFSNRGLHSLNDLLATADQPISAARRRELEAEILKTQKVLSISDSRIAAFREEVDRFQCGGTPAPKDIQLGMLRVLMHRYEKRTPKQRSLFEDEIDPEPSRPITADSGVLDAARIHLLHAYGRPYYFGIDTLSDAASENAEQFLRLAAILVEHATVHLIRSKNASLDATTQDRLLREQATRILNDWSFPQHESVRKLVTAVGKRCQARSLEPNGPLDHGANAFGFPQAEFEDLPKRYPELARILHFGVAYNAFSLLQNYHQGSKDQQWCLLELGGVAILHFGLPLKRGGFIEGSAAELWGIVRGQE